MVLLVGGDFMQSLMYSIVKAAPSLRKKIMRRLYSLPFYFFFLLSHRVPVYFLLYLKRIEVKYGNFSSRCPSKFSFIPFESVVFYSQPNSSSL